MDCIKSVLNQTYNNYEIIIVDDGSTDNSKEIIEQIKNKYPNKIIPIFQENQGQAAAFNVAFKASSGEAITFLDADDTWHVQKLEKIHEEMKKQEIIGVLHPLIKIDSDGYSLPGLAGDCRRLESDLSKFVMDTGNVYWFPPTSGLSFKRLALEKIFPMDKEIWRLCADGCLIFYTAFLGKFSILKTPLGSYRLHSSNNFSTSDKSLTKLKTKPFVEMKVDNAYTDSLSGIKVTNEQINKFLSEIGDSRRVDLSKNLPYRRLKFYLNQELNIFEFAKISQLILHWKPYNINEKVKYSIRFWVKSLILLLTSYFNLK